MDEPVEVEEEAVQVPSAPDIEEDVKPQCSKEVPSIHGNLHYDATIYPDLQEITELSSV